MQHPATPHQAKISEIFSSLQGEGTHLGERHIFIRFEECHMHCTYCDELDKPGTLMSMDAVMQEVRKLEAEEGPHAFVSLTGGEPLLYFPFLKPLIQNIRQEGLRVYLETSGVLVKALEEVAADCDCIAMDMKPASVTGEKNFFEEHRQFLKTALRLGKETFVKIVLSKEILLEEFEALIKIVAEENKRLPVILQPLSAEAEGHEDPKLMKMLGELQRYASRTLERVAIVPRFHKILKIR